MTALNSSDSDSAPAATDAATDSDVDVDVDKSAASGDTAINSPFMNQLLTIVREIYDSLPFNRALGLKVDHLTPSAGGFRFLMKEDLIGNYFQGTLHGGVISAVLDATGGMVATVSTAEKLEGKSEAEITRRLSKIGTIDLRVDYLRPGRGVEFRTTGSILRIGGKLAVARMELINQDDMLIAAGTAAYLVG